MHARFYSRLERKFMKVMRIVINYKYKVFFAVSKYIVDSLPREMLVWFFNFMPFTQWRRNSPAIPAAAGGPAHLRALILLDKLFRNVGYTKLLLFTLNLSLGPDFPLYGGPASCVKHKI